MHSEKSDSCFGGKPVNYALTWMNKARLRCISMIITRRARILHDIAVFFPHILLSGSGECLKINLPRDACTMGPV